MRENGQHRDNDCIRALYLSADEKQHPLENEEKMVVEGCRRMGADAAIFESVDRAIVVATNVYDGTYTLAICDPNSSLSSVARNLQVLLYQQASNAVPTVFLPTVTVRAALGRWERQIAVVFGRRYAARLVASAAGTQAPGRMTEEVLESMRRQLSSAIGGCIDLKAEK